MSEQPPHPIIIRLKELVRAELFKPFEIVLKNGKRYQIKHRDWCWPKPFGTVLAWTKNGQIAMLDPEHVERVDVLEDIATTGNEAMRNENEQTLERVTVKKVKIDEVVVALDIVRRGEKKFVFEIMRNDGNCLVASSDEHKSARRAAKAGKPIWKRTAKAALQEKLDQ